MLVEWLEQHQVPCVYKKYLGVDCLGCGGQRSFIALLKGDVAQSIELFPALLPMLLMLTFLVVHLIMKFEHGGTILKYLFMATAGIMVVSYLFKVL